MAIQSSFHTVAEQVITFNNNLVDTLSKINQLITSNESSLTINILNQSGVVSQFSLPSFGFLKSEIDRLNNNINSMYNISNSGALISTSSSNKFQKVVVMNLNKEPNDVNTLNTITTFQSSKNWFFEGLMNPMLSIKIDLSNKVDYDVRKVLSRRYIINFEQSASGNLTANGQAGLNSFNSLFRNNSSVVLSEFETWHSTTPGVLEPNNPNYDEQLFDLDPNQLNYTGIYTVLKTEEDLINRKLWYWLNTLSYVNNITGEIKQLMIGDQLIINDNVSTTIYEIVEISNASSSPKVRLQRNTGNDPIPVATNSLKIYSPVFYTKSVEITVGYNERNIVFIKPLNMDTYLMSKNWSGGVGFWTNDLRLASDDSYNGSTMEQYYTNEVLDFGKAIKDLVAKKIPNTFAVAPNKPVLDINNFKVLQINKHLTDTADSNLLKKKNNQQKSLQSEIDQLNQAISDKNKQLRVTRFASDAAKNKFLNEIDRLNKTKDTKSSALATVVSDILAISNSAATTPNYKYNVRGFWNMPDPVISIGTIPQEVIQFEIQYRYLSNDGKESPVDTIKLDSKTTAAFSNWIPIKSDVRGRTFNASTNKYTWDAEDVSNPDKVNINQIDIPIQPNETVEVKVRSISEAGWPESVVMSDWSTPITVVFPNDLITNQNQTNAIVTDANKEDIKSSIKADLNAKGLDIHLSETTSLNNNNYFHNASSLLSGFKDTNGIALSVYDYLVSLENRIKTLEERISKVKGELQVVIYRNSDEYVVKNGSEITFNVECEDYLDLYTSSGVPSGRVYANNIYSIKDFLLKIRNVSTSSTLGLLSNRTYVNTSNSDIYNSIAPQIFWVNDQNEVIFSNITGSTKTQIDNQFIWGVNYDSLNQTTITKLSDNVSNNFVAANSNSITSILSSSEFNLGYSDNTILSFVGNNNSLLDISKWIDTTVSVSSTNKLLSTVHASIPKLTDIVETNSSKTHALEGNSSNDINIPINIYFKMNALDPSQNGLNYQYINLNASKTTIKHVKKIKFLLETDVDNRPFVFTVKFNINRNKVVLNKVLTTSTNKA